MLSKKKLVDFLKESGMYKEQDSFLVNELYHNIGIMKQAKALINDKGILTQADKNGTIFYQSQGFKIYDSAFSHVMAIIRKLGLSPRDRKELGTLSDINDDSFDETGS